MNDSKVDWPLWGSEGATDAEDWELSPQLKGRLAVWAAFFNEHFHEEHGFPTVEMARMHCAEGIALQPLVAEHSESHSAASGSVSVQPSSPWFPGSARASTTAAIRAISPA